MTRCRLTDAAYRGLLGGDCFGLNLKKSGFVGLFLCPGLRGLFADLLSLVSHDD
jgi:hypothetical protein